MTWTAIDDVMEALVEPPEGVDQLKGHDPTYRTVRDGVNAVVDTCNDGIDKVNGWISQAGIDFEIPRLFEGGLDEVVVYPLSGNYYRIQQNGAACTILRDGMAVWAGNMRTLATNSVLAFEGQANTAFAAHLGGYSLVMNAIGTVMSTGSVVFDSIALFSEKIAIRVEQALVLLGQKLIKLAKVVSKRFLGGWLSAAALVKDLIEHGLSVITDVIDDVQWCIKAIEKCFELKDEITAWAETQADRLTAFQEVATVIQELPFVDVGVPLAEAEVPDLTSLEDIELDLDFDQTEEGQAAEDAATDEADDLAGESGYVHPSWLEACVTPPPGYGQDPYDPTLPISPNGTIYEDIPPPGETMPLPVPGVSNVAYYAQYERWRETVGPPLSPPPPATGMPADT